MATKAKKVWGGTVIFDGLTVTEITTLGKGKQKRNIIEVFSCDSADEAVEKLSSGIDPGQITFGRVYDGELAGVYAGLATKFAAGTSGTLTITIPGGATLSATALIGELETPGGNAKGGIFEHDVTFEISGAITHIGV